VNGARLAAGGAVALGLVLVAGWFLMGPDGDGAGHGSAELLRAEPAALMPVAVLPEASDLARASDAAELPVEVDRVVAPLAGSAVEGSRSQLIWERLRLLAAASLRSGPDGGEILGVAKDLLAPAPIDEPTVGRRVPPPTRTLLFLPGQGEVRFEPPGRMHVELEARPGEFTGVASDGARRTRMQFTFDVEGALLTEVQLLVQLDYERTPTFAAELARRGGAIVDSRSSVGSNGSTWLPLVLTTSEDPRGLEEWHATPDGRRPIVGTLDANTALDLGRIVAAWAPEPQGERISPHR
jgi:hypothetical protein